MSSISAIRTLIVIFGISLSPAAMALDELSPGGAQASCPTGSPGGCGMSRMLSFPPIQIGLSFMLNGAPLPFPIPCARPIEKRPPIEVANQATHGAVYKLLGNLRALAGVQYSDRFQNTSYKGTAPELTNNPEKKLSEGFSSGESAVAQESDLPGSASAQ